MFPENWLRIKTLVPNLKFPSEWIVPRSYGNFIGVNPSPSGAPCGARVAMLAKTGRGNDNDPGEFLQFPLIFFNAKLGLIIPAVLINPLCPKKKL